MILDIESSLRLIDDLLGYENHGLYHVSNRFKLEEFGNIKSSFNDVLYSIDDVLGAHSDILSIDGDTLILSASDVNHKTVCPTGFYSIIGFKLFKEILEYNIYLTNVYKDYLFLEPISGDTTPYYPEYFSELNNVYNGNYTLAVQNIVSRIIDDTNMTRCIFNKVVSILNTIISSIDMRMFRNNEVYRVSGHSYHVVIENLGNVFELRYKDLLLEKERIII